MLISTNKKELKMLSLLSSRINHIGIILQSKILEDVGSDLFYSNVNTDVLKKRIWLRIELIERNNSIFENDIINLTLEGGTIFFKGSVYSDYGIDNIVNYHDKLDDFNISIFDDILPMLSSCIIEHINFYI